MRVRRYLHRTCVQSSGSPPTMPNRRRRRRPARFGAGGTWTQLPWRCREQPERSDSAIRSPPSATRPGSDETGRPVIVADDDHGAAQVTPSSGADRPSRRRDLGAQGVPARIASLDAAQGDERTDGIAGSTSHSADDAPTGRAADCCSSGDTALVPDGDVEPIRLEPWMPREVSDGDLLYLGGADTSIVIHERSERAR